MNNTKDMVNINEYKYLSKTCKLTKKLFSRIEKALEDAEENDMHNAFAIMIGCARWRRVQSLREEIKTIDKQCRRWEDDDYVVKSLTKEYTPEQLIKLFQRTVKFS